MAQLNFKASFDALPQAAAVLDEQGVIVATNAAWRAFNGLSDGFPMPGAAEGSVYLAGGAQAIGLGDDVVRQAAAGLRSVLGGGRHEIEIEYPWQQPTSTRWFLMRAHALQGPAKGALVIHVEFTGQRQEYIDLQHAQQRLELALEGSGDGTWDWDLRTGRAALSAGYFRLIGYRPEEVISDFEFFKRLVHPEDLPLVLATLDQHFRGVTATSVVEYRMRTATGDTRWIRGRGRVIERDATGAPLRMMGHVTDITAVRDLEAAAQASEARYRILFDAIDEGFCIVELSLDPSGRCVDFYFLDTNPAFARQTGITDAVGRHAHELVTPIESFWLEAFAAVLSSGEPTRFQGYSAGLDRHLDIYAFRLGAEAQHQVGTLVRDISVQKRAEFALQASEARYRALVEDQTECISRVAADGILLYANDAYCRYFGRRASELVGSSWHPVAHPDDVPFIEARIGGMSPENSVVNIENRVYAADGKLRWMHFVNRSFFEPGGRLLEIQSVGRDITDRKLAEHARQQLHDENTRLGREMIRLQEVERASLATQLHDGLSQQLVAIRAYAGAIRRSAGESKLGANAAAIEAAVDEIYKASHRLLEGLHPQVLDSAGLPAAIGLLLASHAEAFPECRVWLRRAGNVEIEDAETRIGLFRVIQECLANAMAHAGARRVRVFLGERQGPAGRSLRLVVRDDGCGMDLSMAHAGFGLIVMRERTRAMGGQLGFSSRPGQGLRVVADVPAGNRAN